MKFTFIWTGLLAILLFIPGALFAGQWEGTIQGLHCVTIGKICPVGYEDPMAQAEENFVLLQENGDWYLLHNLKRGILARHINDNVRVIGEMQSKYQAIDVKALKVYKDDAYETVWSEEMQKEYEELIGITGQ